MDIELPFDFKEFLKLLNGNGVRYLLIGGYAVGYHGYPRATKLRQNKWLVPYMGRAICFSREELTTRKPGQKDWILFYLKEALDEFQDVWQVNTIRVRHTRTVAVGHIRVHRQHDVGATQQIRTP